MHSPHRPTLLHAFSSPPTLCRSTRPRESIRITGSPSNVLTQSVGVYGGPIVPQERDPPPLSLAIFLWLPPMIFFITIVQSIFLIRVRCAYSGLTRSQQSHVEALPGNDIDSPGLQGKGASQVIAGTWFLGTSFSESEDLFV